jgi:hypothetical protein
MYDVVDFVHELEYRTYDIVRTTSANPVAIMHYYFSKIIVK